MNKPTPPGPRRRPWDLLPVKRTLRAGAPGTQRLQLEHGSALVCVRYRENAAGTERYTTVELLIDRRPSPTCLVRLAVDVRETRLQQRLREQGATWDGPRRCWLIQLRKVRRMKLMDRVLGYEKSTQTPTKAKLR